MCVRVCVYEQIVLKMFFLKKEVLKYWPAEKDQT